jgi:glycogen(starch) synthase
LAKPRVATWKPGRPGRISRALWKPLLSECPASGRLTTVRAIPLYQLRNDFPDELFLMKLLLYSHFFPPSVGGVESIVLSLARGLAELSAADSLKVFDLTVVTLTPRKSFRDEELPFRVVRQPTSKQLQHWIRWADVAHIAGASLAPVAWGLIHRKPVVVEHHAFQAVCPTGQLFQEPQNLPCPGHFMAGRHANCLRCSQTPRPMRSLKLWLSTFVRRFLCSRVALNIAPTAWLGSLLDLPRTEVIPHGLDTSGALTSVSPSRQTPVLLFIGRLVSTKGVSVLLRGARLLADQGHAFELLIIGDGPERAALEKQTQTSALTSQVKFLGSLPAQEIEKYFSKANIIVVPSLAGEVFGLVIAENMLRGIPIVASDLGAFSEVLAETGQLFPIGDAAGLASQIARLLANPVEAADLASAARHRVLDFFPLRRMIEAHAAAYRRVSKMGR